MIRHKLIGQNSRNKLCFNQKVEQGTNNYFIISYNDMVILRRNVSKWLVIIHDCNQVLSMSQRVKYQRILIIVRNDYILNLNLLIMLKNRKLCHNCKNE